VQARAVPARAFLTSTLTLFLCAALAPTLHAQTATVSAAMDRQVSRARALVERGEGAEARNVLDSLVAAAPAASDDLAEALFWRAAYAERITDAERDWKRLVIESPLSPRTPDALVRLGELELLRAHPKDARTWFERVVREFPTGTQGTRSALLIARSWFDEQDLARGCSALTDARALNLPDGELKLQAEEMGRRCAGAAAGAAATAATQRPGVGSRAPGAAAQTPAQAVAPISAPTPRPTTPTSVPSAPAAAPSAPASTASATTGRFSVQLAAYNTRREADEAVARLARRGLDVRVDGDDKPFRVRSGRYATRAQAAAALAALKKQGLDGFIAELAP
jgi:cell division septation protein DedD